MGCHLLFRPLNIFEMAQGFQGLNVHGHSIVYGTREETGTLVVGGVGVGWGVSAEVWGKEVGV